MLIDNLPLSDVFRFWCRLSATSSLLFPFHVCRRLSNYLSTLCFCFFTRKLGEAQNTYLSFTDRRLPLRNSICPSEIKFCSILVDWMVLAQWRLLFRRFPDRMSNQQTLFIWILQTKLGCNDLTLYFI